MSVLSDRGGRSRRPGVALMFVLLIMMILMAITMGFAAFTTSDMKASDANWEQVTCYHLAEAGVDYGMFLLKRNLLIYPPVANTAPAYSPGALYNIFRGQDHMVISSMSYGGETNWMDGTAYCGTFRVSATIAANSSQPASKKIGTTRYTLTLNSTGFIRKLGTDLATISSWPIKAQRTVGATLVLDSTNQDYDKAQGNTEVKWDTLEAIRVEQFYEKFR